MKGFAMDDANESTMRKYWLALFLLVAVMMIVAAGGFVVMQSDGDDGRYSLEVERLWQQLSGEPDAILRPIVIYEKRYDWQDQEAARGK
jgi:hypothetical protein